MYIKLILIFTQYKICHGSKMISIWTPPISIHNRWQPHTHSTYNSAYTWFCWCHYVNKMCPFKWERCIQQIDLEHFNIILYVWQMWWILLFFCFGLCHENKAQAVKFLKTPKSDFIMVRIFYWIFFFGFCFWHFMSFFWFWSNVTTMYFVGKPGRQYKYIGMYIQSAKDIYSIYFGIFTVYTTFTHRK